MKFHAIIQQNGKTATGIKIPSKIIESLGKSKRPAVRVTINGHTYRSTVAVMGGVFLVGVSAENRQSAGVAGGDEVDVDIELDTEVRQVTVPVDLAKVLDGAPNAKRSFNKLSYSNQLRHVLSIEGAKTAETRERRVAKAISELSQIANNT
jgi:hypothetical protein